MTQSLHFLDSFEPRIVYPVGKYIGIRNLVLGQMEFVKAGNEKADDSEREVIGLYINHQGSRKYLAICDKDNRTGHIWVNIYDHKNKKLMKQIDITAEVYGSASQYKRE